MGVAYSPFSRVSLPMLSGMLPLSGSVPSRDLRRGSIVRGCRRVRVESQFCHAKLIPSGNILRSNTITITIMPCRVRGAVAPAFEHLTRRIIQVAQRLRHTWGEPILFVSHWAQSFSCWGTVQSSWLSLLPHRGSAASMSNDHSTTKQTD